MNRIRLFLPLLPFLLCALLFQIACDGSSGGNRQIENALPQNSGNSQNGSVSQMPVNASAPNANPDSSDVKTGSNAVPRTNETNAAEDNSADFTGTAGTTDRKKKIAGTALLKEIRAAEHAGYDRIVFEFTGAELPSYHIEYVDKPVRACGSGDVVALKGDGWLEIRFTPAAAHTEAGEPTVKNRQQAPNFKIIKELKQTCDFEAEVEWALGLSAPNKYRVLELKNPTRLAIDIKH